MKRFPAKDLFTIPNLMGYFRILLIPVFSVMYVNANTTEDYLWAAAVVLLSSLTDLFDGKIARRFHMITEFGKVLDPIADKLTHAALAVCLAIRHPLMWALIALMIFKEGYMGLSGLYFLKRGRMLNGAMWFGKICTTVLFAGLLVLFLFPEMPEIGADILILFMIAVMIFTLCKYVPVFRGMKRECDAEKAAQEAKKQQ